MTRARAPNRLVPGGGVVRDVEDRFRERKLQHDLAFVVGHLDGRVQQGPLGAFGLQQFPDHGPRDFPGAIGVAQIFTFGIGHQFVSDPGVEVIAWHGLRPTFCYRLPGGTQHRSQVIYSGSLALPNPAVPGRSTQTALNLLIPCWFDSRPHEYVNFILRCSIRMMAKISLANFCGGITLSMRAGIRPVREGEPQWPGRPRRSSKCRLAWKSTCMRAPPASKRQRQLHV